MKHLKHYLNIITMLMLLLQFTFTSCEEGGDDTLIPNGSNSVCLVNVVSGEGGTATTSRSQVMSGREVTLTATPSEGYAFVNWTVEGKEVSKENPYTTTITATTQFKANFEVVTTDNKYAYVDLGLSVKWAACNVGATTPEEYGDYFAWGETTPKKIYNWSTYKWSNEDGTSMTKYCTSIEDGTVDNKTVLELSDDAAHVNWGGSWRMPTKAEQDELRDTNNCTWEWITQNGVRGYKVTSKKNGNSIFLPAAGYRYDIRLNLADSFGDYWSSSLCPTTNDYVYLMFFNLDFWSWDTYFRSMGLSVRAVCE